MAAATEMGVEPGIEEETEPPRLAVTEADDVAAGRSEEEALRLKAEGNALFSASKWLDALEKYDEAVDVAPRRPECSKSLAALHANRAACFLKLEQYTECISACDDCLDLDDKYEKAMLRRASALEGMEKIDDAMQGGCRCERVCCTCFTCLSVCADYEDILEQFPKHPVATAALARLKRGAAERDEKLKDEMMGKLKDLGNSLLGNFGMSLDNFEMKQDPATGGYSINFKQGGQPPPPSEG
jgi:tetratricopeptide (TPR) repeat protein